jgi:hypothetical protein
MGTSSNSGSHLNPIDLKTTLKQKGVSLNPSRKNLKAFCDISIKAPND